MHPKQMRHDLIVVGGHAVVFEVNLRKLCERYPQSTDEAYGNLDAKVLPAVLGVFAAHLSDDERHLLTQCVTLRNEICHGHFQRLENALASKFGIESKVAVHEIELTSDEPPKPVKGRQQKGDAGRYAWELQAHASGAIVRAGQKLAEGIQLLDRLVTIEDPTSSGS